jgi:hypothetical protein
MCVLLVANIDKIGPVEQLRTQTEAVVSLLGPFEPIVCDAINNESIDDLAATPQDERDIATTFLVELDTDKRNVRRYGPMWPGRLDILAPVALVLLRPGIRRTGEKESKKRG